jgi:hypothetical protein
MRAFRLLLALAVMYATPAWSAAEMRQLTVGQIWTIKDSPGPDTRIVIGRIEGDIIHISIFDVPTPPDYPLRKGPISIGHSPFARAAIDESIDDLLGSTGKTESSFEEGYEHWKSNNGGYFTVPVSKAIAFTLEAVTKGRRD